jgi:hypothetical protein
MLSHKHADQPSAQTGAVQPSLLRAATDTPKLPPGRALNHINDALKSENPPIGFLPAGESTLLAMSDEFIASLGVEAIRVARARNATAVDRQDIKEADRKLRGNNAAERRAWLLGLGGVAGGAGAAAIVAVIASPVPVRHATDWWLIIAMFVVAAVALVSASYPRPGRHA